MYKPTTEQMREAVKKVNRSPKWVRKVANMSVNEVADTYKRLKLQNQI